MFPPSSWTTSNEYVLIVLQGSVRSRVTVVPGIKPSRQWPKYHGFAGMFFAALENSSTQPVTLPRDIFFVRVASLFRSLPFGRWVSALFSLVMFLRPVGELIHVNNFKMIFFGGSRQIFLSVQVPCLRGPLVPCDMIHFTDFEPLRSALCSSPSVGLRDCANEWMSKNRLCYGRSLVSWSLNLSSNTTHYTLRLT